MYLSVYESQNLRFQSTNGPKLVAHAVTIREVLMSLIPKTLEGRDVPFFG